MQLGMGCPLCKAGLDKFGYRDVLLLKQFLTPEGYIIGRRQTGLYMNLVCSVCCACACMFCVYVYACVCVCGIF